VSFAIRPLALGAALICITLAIGCARFASRADNRVDRYETWLNMQSPRRRGVGRPKSPADVEFERDLRAKPESGLSKIHLKSAPGAPYYIYDDHRQQLNPGVSFFRQSSAWRETSIDVCPPIPRNDNCRKTVEECSLDHEGKAAALMGPQAGERTLPRRPAQRVAALGLRDHREETCGHGEHRLVACTRQAQHLWAG
jgi:hypothetical protein